MDIPNRTYMKNLILTLLMALSMNSYSQKSISILISPEDIGVGPMYSQTFNKIIISQGVTYGNYKYFPKDHWKTYTSIGYFWCDQGYFLADIHYNTFRENIQKPFWFNDKALQKWTYSLGTGIVLDRFHGTLQYDVIQHVGTVSFGIYFGNKSTRKHKTNWEQ